MKLSVIICTKNRAYAIAPCLNSIATAFAAAAPLDAEIVVVDNGSTDGTADIIKAWAGTSGVAIKLLSEPRAGRSRALNCALRASEGELIAFTDDDCRLHSEYVNDLLRHDAADTDLVLRGGRIELGDPTDLPFTINTSPVKARWSLAMNSARRGRLTGYIFGCNMAARWPLIERIGPFDENFGPGSKIGSGDDADYLFRTYLAGFTLEYVPDMVVFHHHGRKTSAAANALFHRYAIGVGGWGMKYILRHPNFCRPIYWNLSKIPREIVSGRNLLSPDIGFSHRDEFACIVRGALRYLFMREECQIDQDSLRRKTNLD